jgi:hypothetical protein
MKTMKKFTVLSLVTLLSCLIPVISGFASNDGPKEFTSGSVRYDVNIHYLADQMPCDVYLIQIIDEKGRVVAPVQRLEAGITKYTFHENGLLRGKFRIATIVRAIIPDHYVCVYELHTQADRMEGPFLYGHSYSFDLYPVLLVPEEARQNKVSDR